MTETHILLKNIVPELIDLFQTRYTILRSIHSCQPIGRRMLSTSIDMGERTIRRETTFLKEAGFIDIDSSGMVVTPQGEVLIDGLEDFMHELMGLHELEQKIANLLNLKQVIIVPGNLDENELVLKDIGKSAAKFLTDVVKNDSIIAVTGGSSVGAAVRALSQSRLDSNIIVIPARGGIGREVENQANTLVSILAKKLNGQYRLLHVPDQLGARAAESLLNEPDIKNVVDVLKRADILVCGIGRAEEMARRRNLSPAMNDDLKRAGAVAEAFGYYFNKQGDIVYASNSIGLNINDVRNTPIAIGVAGGRQKAEAIVAVLTHWGNSVLVTDEGAANEIVNLYNK